MANIEINTLQPSQIKFYEKIKQWKLRNANTHKNNTIIFGQNSLGKPNVGKSVQQLRVLLLCRSEKLLSTTGC